MTAYDTLADVYEFLVPDALLEPDGAVAAFAAVRDALPPGARVLDCACGTGQLAVGLARAGFAVTASDASAAMVARTRALAAHHGVSVAAEVRDWEALAGEFDAVLCVGNSLVHAAGRAGRRRALAAMARVLAPGGLVAVTSRNWERERAAGSRLDVADRAVRRGGRDGIVVRAWTMPDAWDAPHRLDVAVVLPAPDGAVTSAAETLTLWPFTPEELDADLRAAALTPATSTFTPAAERYLVTARARGGRVNSGH